jgi:hypothetical protein
MLMRVMRGNARPGIRWFALLAGLFHRYTEGEKTNCLARMRESRPVGDEDSSFGRKHVINQNRPILYLQQPCDDAVPYFMERIQQSGLQVIRTFDLHDTRMVDTACSCPHHGTVQCDCQMVVLLVYGKDNQPASLVVHGYNGQTWFSLVEFLGSTNALLEAQICSILTPSVADQTARNLS